MQQKLTEAIKVVYGFVLIILLGLGGYWVFKNVLIDLPIQFYLVVISGQLMLLTGRIGRK